MSKSGKITIRFKPVLGDVIVVALDEEGEIVARHHSSDENWAEADIQRPHNLKAMAERYPDGYELVWE